MFIFGLTLEILEIIVFFMSWMKEVPYYLFGSPQQFTDSKFSLSKNPPRLDLFFPQKTYNHKTFELNDPEAEHKISPPQLITAFDDPLFSAPHPLKEMLMRWLKEKSDALMPPIQHYLSGRYPYIKLFDKAGGQALFESLSNKELVQFLDLFIEGKKPRVIEVYVTKGLGRKPHVYLLFPEKGTASFALCMGTVTEFKEILSKQRPFPRHTFLDQVIKKDYFLNGVPSQTNPS